ncbi:regulatory factor X-associated protein-like [Physeter macrocephalus]|uniref:Regulatory factor X-associated protein-like n=1 Tax=Physeter macrocephalus TaxID=9755 RepID=A0A9W2WGU1_PHYMC|nr:regulatory factor X-associated protein-like [Physeter catodon]
MPRCPTSREGMFGATKKGEKGTKCLSSAEVQAVAEGRAPPRGPRPCPAASQFILLVMRPCGGQDEAAAQGVLRQAPALGGSARAARSFGGSGGGGDLLWGRGRQRWSPETGQRRGSASKTCTCEGCSQTPSRAARQRKPWMCKKHRDKMYKDKYKKEKSDQALNCGGASQPGSAGNVRPEESAE